jgi:ATP-dependent protease ClpP protease subunit
MSEETKKDKKLIVKTEFHSLYKAVIEGGFVLANGDEPGVDSLFKKYETTNIYKLYIGPIHDKDIDFQPLLHALTTTCDKERIMLIIGSGGGYLTQGIQLYSRILTGTSRDNITTVITSHAYSMAALLFCMGNTRTINNHSMLMFHNFSVFMGGKGGELIDDLESTHNMFNKLFEELVVGPGFITREELSRIHDGKDLWLDAKEMAERGIANFVTVLGERMTAKEYLESLKDNKTKKPKVTDKSTGPFKPGSKRYLISKEIERILTLSRFSKGAKASQIYHNMSLQKLNVTLRGIKITLGIMVKNEILMKKDDKYILVKGDKS